MGDNLAFRPEKGSHNRVFGPISRPRQLFFSSQRVSQIGRTELARKAPETQAHSRREPSSSRRRMSSAAGREVSRLGLGSSNRARSVFARRGRFSRLLGVLRVWHLNHVFPIR